MIFAVLDVSLIIGLNIGETDKVFFTLICLVAAAMHSDCIFFVCLQILLLTYLGLLILLS